MVQVLGPGHGRRQVMEDREKMRREERYQERWRFLGEGCVVRAI